MIVDILQIKLQKINFCTAHPIFIRIHHRHLQFSNSFGNPRCFLKSSANDLGSSTHRIWLDSLVWSGNPAILDLSFLHDVFFLTFGDHNHRNGGFFSFISESVSSPLMRAYFHLRKRCQNSRFQIYQHHDRCYK
jgi:hypothetical protein